MNNDRRSDALVFDENIFKRVLSENLVEINGKKINKNIIRNIFFLDSINNYAYKVFSGVLPYFIVDINDNYLSNRAIILTKVEVIRLLKKIVKEEKENGFTLDDIKDLEKYCSVDTLLEKNTGKIFNYMIDGLNYNISFDDIWNFYNCSVSEYNNFLNNDIIYGIKKEYFIYVCIDFFKKNVIDDIMLPDNIYNRYKELSSYKKIDVEAINTINSTYDPELDKVKVSSELEKNVFDNMPNNLSDLEKAIYIYGKMCKILSYDEEYYALDQKGVTTRNHRSIDYLGEITPDNPKVVCYEFNALYGYFLNKLGINYEIARGFLAKYSSGHANLSFRVGKYLVNADAATSILNGDMFLAKINESLRGLDCVNHNKDSKKEFKDMFDKVMKLVNTSSKNMSTEDILFEYRKIKGDNYKTDYLEVIDKLNILVSIIKNIDMRNIDQVASLLFFAKKIFTEEELKEEINLVVVKDTPNFSEDNKYASASIIASVKQASGEYVYYRIVNGGVIIEESKEDLEWYFSNNTMEEISYDRPIPGVRMGVR